MKRLHLKLWHLFYAFSLIAFVGAGVVLATTADPTPAPIVNTASPMHPAIVLQDAEGVSVVESGKPISTMKTCGTCHDTDFIVSHSFHTDAGLSQMSAFAPQSGDSAWDLSNGYFGEWNPITYRYLSPEDSPTPDLTTAEWVMTMGYRHVGGGPASIARDGQSLLEKQPEASHLETSLIGADGERVAWDWSESGVVEMNCFLCHTTTPNNLARIQALESGQFQWANTATLLGTGLVEEKDGVFVWNSSSFGENQTVSMDTLPIQDPTSANCGACHGVVHTDNRTPMTIQIDSQTTWTTLTTGQIMSPQRISNSALNIASKPSLSRSWDIHAERALNCTNCHYSVNNPVYYQRADENQLDHLVFDPRRLDFGEYLERPSHDFARGENETMRRCESCHSIENNHTWLPYKDRHTEVLACESCHIPQVYAPALESIDWTVLQADGQPITLYRGIEGADLNAQTSLVSGYTPILLPDENSDGTKPLSPFNLVTAWYWVYGEQGLPVPQRDLTAVWLENGQYPADLLALFDADKDGALSTQELYIDTEAKQTLLVQRLEARGLNNPRIVGETRPYGVHHNVTTGNWAVKSCESCHAQESRLSAVFTLSNRTPMNTLPVLNSNALSALSPEIGTDGMLTVQPIPAALNLYVFGNSTVEWVDTLGMLAFLGTLAGVSLHGLGRYIASRRRANHAHTPELRRVYMYSVYERQWHWLQTALIFALIFTGIVIHRPDRFPLFSMDWMVLVHNVLALVLVINAALAAFYHLASGEIRQFLPQPRGFFNDAISQAKFYLQGIFSGAPHPFEKSPEKKMNPLQQMTYLMILNVLLPAQVITGVLMWGLQQFPDVANLFGGLPVLAPLHTLIAWLFATFIVAHVYLTTTAHEPLAGIRAMMMGWDEIEVHTSETAHEAKLSEEALS